ncbi:MAG TPA: carboxypeptidase-like regulatory domain-containing protein, partial [Planctomycetota bacterium]|nr:carboxypeptidase-like regulatory domain-containing protein [Planctomycetota bacterium]
LQRRLFADADATARTSSDGRFRFDDLTAGTFDVYAHTDGFQPAQVSVEVPEEPGATSTEIKLEKGLVLRGLVLDDAGRPVPNAFVTIGRDEGLDRGRQDWERRRFEEERQRLERDGRIDEIARLEEEAARREEAETREPVNVVFASAAVKSGLDGRFAIDTLSEGVYTVSAEAEGFVARRATDVVLDESNREEEVKLELDSGDALIGKVVSAADRAPVANARIELRRDGGFGRGEVRHVRSDDKGEFRIQGLVAGDRWSLVADADGYSLAFVENVEIQSSESTDDLEIRLDQTAKIRGRVISDLGAPVAGATIRIRDDVEPARGRGGPGGRGGRGGPEGGDRGEEW